MDEKKTNGIIKKFLCGASAPAIFYFLCMLIIHLTYKCENDDLAIIRDTLKPTVLEEFSSVLYNFSNWSSRVIVNLPIHIMLHFDYKIWFVIEMLLFLAMFVGFAYICVTDNKIVNRYILLALLLMFPFYNVTTAGWVTTTMTYIWPLAVGVLICTSIRKYFNGEKFKWYEYLLYFVGTLYAGNQEQMSVLLTVLFVTIIVLSIKGKRLSPMIIMQGVISLGNLMFHMLTPGNQVRSIAEADKFFPDYETLSIVDKFELGFSSSMYEFIFRCNPIFIVIGILLIVGVFMKYKNVFYRLISTVPLLCQLFLGVICEQFIEGRLHIAIFANRIESDGTITSGNYYRFVSYIPMIIIFIVSICLIVSIYLLFGNSNKTVVSIALLFGGLGARMVVAFSPTVWASLNRTFTVMYFALIGLAILLANEIDYNKLGKKKYAVIGLVALVGLVRYELILKTMY